MTIVFGAGAKTGFLSIWLNRDVHLSEDSHGVVDVVGGGLPPSAGTPLLV